MAPIRNSPRSVWLMYTCICEDTITTSSRGLTGSVTHAWRMWVVIGSGTPAMSQINVLQPAVRIRTVPALIVPRSVFTAVTRPLERSNPSHLGVWMDLDAGAVGAARVAPHDGVVADDPARRVVQRAV